MMPLFLAAAFSIAVGVGLVAAPGIASPMQAARTDVEPWAGLDLLLVFNQEELARNWKQLQSDLKQKWSSFIDDDLLYIEGRYDTSDGQLKRYGDRKSEVEHWTDRWFKEHDIGANTKPVP
jgi:uncharacterized protein YjbJ (UPF0337 family)